MYQQCLLCDSTAEIHTRHTWAPPINARARHCPKPTWLARPASHPLDPILLLLPTRAGFKLCVSYKNASDSPGQTFRSLRCARTALCFLPSFLSRTKPHTLCALLRPTTQSAAYTATKGERREFLAWGETCQRAPAYISLGEGHEGSSSHTGVVTAGQRRGDRKIVACAGGWVGEEKRPSWHLFPTLLIPFQARYGRWPAVAKLGMTSPAWHGTCPVLSFPLPFAPVVASRKNYSAGRSFFVSLHR